MYQLEYTSPYTRFAVGPYVSIEACMVDCVRRYGQMCIFKRGEDGTFKATVYGEEEITLTLSAQEATHAAIRR